MAQFAENPVNARIVIRPCITSSIAAPGCCVAQPDQLENLTRVDRSQPRRAVAPTEPVSQSLCCHSLDGRYGRTTEVLAISRQVVRWRFRSLSTGRVALIPVTWLLWALLLTSCVSSNTERGHEVACQRSDLTERSEAVRGGRRNHPTTPGAGFVEAGEMTSSAFHFLQTAVHEIDVSEDWGEMHPIAAVRQSGAAGAARRLLLMATRDCPLGASEFLIAATLGLGGAANTYQLPDANYLEFAAIVFSDDAAGCDDLVLCSVPWICDEHHGPIVIRLDPTSLDELGRAEVSARDQLRFRARLSGRKSAFDGRPGVLLFGSIDETGADVTQQAVLLALPEFSPVTSWSLTPRLGQVFDCEVVSKEGGVAELFVSSRSGAGRKMSKLSDSDGAIEWSVDVDGFASDVAWNSGASLNAVGDVDGDSVDDIVIFLKGFDDDGRGATGVVACVSTSDGALLWLSQARPVFQGCQLTVVRDISGDGVEELLLHGGAVSGEGAATDLLIVDGATGAVVLENQKPAWTPEQGVSAIVEYDSPRGREGNVLTILVPNATGRIYAELHVSRTE